MKSKTLLVGAFLILFVSLVFLLGSFFYSGLWRVAYNAISYPEYLSSSSQKVENTDLLSQDGNSEVLEKYGKL